MLKKLLYLKKNAFEEKKNKFCTVKLLYLKERKIQHQEKWLMKKTSLPKRKQCWKMLMYLKEKKFGLK